MGQGEFLADFLRESRERDIEEDLTVGAEFEEGRFLVPEAGGVDDVLAVFLDHGETVVVVAGVGQVAEVFALGGVDLDAALLAAEDGDVEIACGIDIDLTMGVADVFHAFGRRRPAFVEIVFVGGCEGREGGEDQDWFHKFQISKSNFQKVRLEHDAHPTRMRPYRIIKNSVLKSALSPHPEESPQRNHVSLFLES